MNHEGPFSRLMLAGLLALVSTFALADKQPAGRMSDGQDSLTFRSTSWKEVPQARMAQSLYPVELKVKGHSLRVVSKYEQVLPIYTKSGTLYLAMQLTPGVNWLSGLPRGRYRINNRTINIK